MQPAKTPLQHPLSVAQAIDLLDRLEHDDAFRAVFQADAALALAQLGAPIDVARCIQVSQLASKASIREARLVLIGQLTSAVTHIPHRLQASEEATTLPSTRLVVAE